MALGLAKITYLGAFAVDAAFENRQLHQVGIRIRRYRIIAAGTLLPRPHIRFFFIGSCLCSTLLAGPRLAASVISPLLCASL
jgi:hypothetical protein